MGLINRDPFLEDYLIDLSTSLSSPPASETPQVSSLRRKSGKRDRPLSVCGTPDYLGK